MNIKQVKPSAERDSYVANNLLDFQMSFSGEKLKANSVRLVGKLIVLKGANPIEQTDNVFFDRFSGAHGTIASVSTSLDNAGKIETLNQYGRLVRMNEESKNIPIDMLVNSMNNIELKHDYQKHSPYILTGEAGQNGYLPFSISLQHCLNKMTGDLSHKKSGDILVSIRLAPNNHFLWGKDVDATYNYSLSEVQLHYETVPEDNSKENVGLGIVYSLANDVVSQQEYFTLKPPIECNSISCSMIEKNKLNSLACNELTTQYVPISRLEFAFNNNLSKFYTYDLESEEDILRNYKQSLSLPKSHSYRRYRLDRSSIAQDANNNEIVPDGWGIGMRLPEPVNFANNAFSANMRSDAGVTGKTYTAFWYFHGEKVM